MIAVPYTQIDTVQCAHHLHIGGSTSLIIWTPRSTWLYTVLRINAILITGRSTVNNSQFYHTVSQRKIPFRLKLCLQELSTFLILLLLMLNVVVRSPTRRGTIHQIYDNIGGRGYYVGDMRWHIRPNSARAFRQTVFIGRIRWLHLRRIRRLVQSWPVNNVSTHWNCQRWIIEIIYWLWNAGLLVVRERSLRRLIRMREYWQ
jgi:hypothetical protein